MSLQREHERRRWTRLGNALLRLCQVLGDERVVGEEEADADEREHDVYARAQPGRLGQRKLLRLDRVLLAPADASASAHRAPRKRTLSPIRVR